MRHQLIWAGLASLVLAGCSSVDVWAPIDDRASASAIGTADGAAPVAKAPVHLVKEAPAVASGRVHQVVKGDTLYNISVRYGVNPRQLQSLNGIKDPTQLSLGTELMIPQGDQPALASGTEQLVQGQEVALQAGAAKTAAVQQQGASVERAKRPETPEQAAQRQIDAQQKMREAASRGEIEIMWPTKGDVIASFKETKAGIDIAGNKGDPIVAVLDGTVQYVGSNAEGYGNFVIIRHNIRLPGKGNVPLISVYGNTSRILVKTKESVRAGQQIAEMGDSQADQVKLRFELRQGRPLDPIPYLAK